jgi:hypothetical protein
MADKAELVITALQQRIGEIVSNYETQIAILRAELTQQMQEKEEKEKAVKEFENPLPTPKLPIQTPSLLPENGKKGGKKSKTKKFSY